MALANSCCLHQMRGDCAAVEANLAVLLDLAAKKGIAVFQGVGRLLHGWARAYRGAVDEGIELMRDALTKLASTEHQVEQPYERALLAEVYLRAGRRATPTVPSCSSIELSRSPGRSRRVCGNCARPTDSPDCGAKPAG
jgi:predicted ATPase